VPPKTTEGGLSDIAEAEGLAVFFEEAFFEQGVLGAGEGGIVVDPFFGVAAGHAKEVEVIGVGEIGDGEGREAGLARAEEFAVAADGEVVFGDFEAVGGIEEGADAGATVFGHFLIGGSDGETTTGDGTPTHATPELVELGEAEAVGVFDDHGGGFGDIDADFDDGGANKDGDFAGAKLIHDAFALGWFHAAVEHAEVLVGEGASGELVVEGLDVGEAGGRFVDDGDEDEDSAPGMVAGFWFLVFGFY